MNHLNYKLRDVVELTGFSKQVLHAWEHRYAAMSPSGTQKSPRLYSDAEVHRLQLLRTCINAGHRIGQLASLPIDELKQISGACDPVTDVPLDTLLSAVQSVKSDYLESNLSMHFATLGPIRFVETIVVPLMNEVGSKWQTGEICVAAEHCVSAIIRTLLGQALRQTISSPSNALAIFTTPEDELHELGALAAAALAQSTGLRTLYMGPQLPVGSLAEAAKMLGASVVGLSASTLSKADIERYLPELTSSLPPDVEIWLGGCAFDALRINLPPRTSCFDDTVDYLAAIRRHCIRTTRA